MRNLYILLLSLLCLFMGSCEKAKLSYKRGLLIGHWTYSKAKFTKNLSLKSTDLLENYDESAVQFRDDGTMILDDKDNGHYYTGSWLLEEESFVNDNADPETERWIEMVLTDTATQEQFTEYWDDLVIREECIRFTQETDDGNWRFNMDKSE